jgi:hypothetical protein
MDWLWTWGGISFGYKVDDRVFTHLGLQIGRVDGEEVYASDGRYCKSYEVSAHGRYGCRPRISWGRLHRRNQ